jgi:hypothetical protein
MKALQALGALCSQAYFATHACNWEMAKTCSSNFHIGMQQRQQEFTNYRDYIGMDITSLVALPVWIMMPFSMLQNISEIMEYTDRLEKAAKTEDPYER